MRTTITGTFETRRQAELVVEHLVQELDIARDDIEIAPEDDENSAGEENDGADADGEQDAALNGRIAVSVEVMDEADGEAVEAAFEKMGAEDVTN